MSEKTLLVEIEKEQKQMIEKKFAMAKEERQEKENENAIKQGKKIMFSSSAFPNISRALMDKKKQEEEISKIESKVSTVIEKPNYDYMESLTEAQKEKVFKVEKTQAQEVKPKPSKIKWIVASILFAIFGVWGVVNIVTLSDLTPKVSNIESVYQFNLLTYAKNLATLDATSAENMENLLPTIPEQEFDATEIEKRSNWFDRFCNFIGGLFGG